jgi:hypothetical protein
MAQLFPLFNFALHSAPKKHKDHKATDQVEMMSQGEEKRVQGNGI